MERTYPPHGRHRCALVSQDGNVVAPRATYRPDLGRTSGRMYDGLNRLLSIRVIPFNNPGSPLNNNCKTDFSTVSTHKSFPGVF